VPSSAALALVGQMKSDSLPGMIARIMREVDSAAQPQDLQNAHSLTETIENLIFSKFKDLQ
jgi:hypothetical protein